MAEELPATLESLACGEFRADHPPFTDFYATPVHLVHGPTPSFRTRTPNAPLANLRTNHDWPSLVTEAGPGLYRVREDLGWPTFVAKTALGTVPIAEDGSVNFIAPAGKVLYFHLLDENFDELQRMRSVVQLQPGEQRGCVGCHESRVMAWSARPALALRRKPRRLEAPSWGAVPFAYEKVVQPVWDAHCVRCHDANHERKVDLTKTARIGTGVEIKKSISPARYMACSRTPNRW